MLLFRGRVAAVLLLASGFVVDKVAADFGDTVDPTFNCPALTTCAQVCVATVEDCPEEMRCPGNTTTLCVDGSCMEECPPPAPGDDDAAAGDDDAAVEGGIVLPCAFECAPVACNRIDDYFDACTDKYGDLYAAAKECGEEEEAYETALLEYKEPAFIFGYAWVTGLSFFIILWCAFNQKFAPVEGSTKSLQIDPQDALTDSVTSTWNEEGEAVNLQCTQTGYKTHFVGLSLYYLTMITYAGWSAALAFLTIQYYVWNEQPQLANVALRIEDETQILKTFIIVWNVGFVWCFALKWPYSIKSLFLRQCALSEATHVAVFLNNGQDDLSKASTAAVLQEGSWVKCTVNCMAAVFRCINSFMAFLFSDTNAHLRKEGLFEYCKVKYDKDGTRSFTFLFRRYNFCRLPNPKASMGTENTEKDEKAEDEDSDDKQRATMDIKHKNHIKSYHGGVFIPGSWPMAETLGQLSQLGKNEVGLTAQDVKERYRAVGLNTIEMIKPTFIRALREEFAKPFYTYQLFLIWSWMPLYYYYMAMIIALTVISSAVVVAYFHYRNLNSLYQVTYITGQAQVLRNGEWALVNQRNLLPGDLVKLASGVTYCDMVLLRGGYVLVDESALTGEATPQVKTAVDASDPNVKYRPYIHKRHTVSAGTSILEAEDATALVMKTASYTAKGELLREIFAFRRHSFKFDTEVYIVLGILVLIAIFGFSVTIYLVKDSAVAGWFYAMYVVATAIPPLLPTTFTVSVGVSDARLANKKIACSHSESILVAGKVTRAFFDKTGTLTKQGLDFKSARSANDWTSETISHDMAMAMASCHAVSFSSTGLLVGNPVDRTMFTVSGATLETLGGTTVVTDSNGKRLEVVKHFDFDHHRMTQSVIVKLTDEKGSFVAFVKGSGESVSKICESDSLPSEFDSSVGKSAALGIYQIAVAMKRLDADSISTIRRDDIENDCTFIGVLNFLNAMREETPDVIRQLSEGAVDSIVVTGDNTMNGIRAAKEAGIINANKVVIIGNVPHDSDSIIWTDEAGKEVGMPSSDELESNHIQLAMSGNAWLALRTQDPKVASHTAPFVKVFGRCTPYDKVSVVDTFVELGFITMMCGDGGNDCGALKAAHVGIALSDAEASIVSPFTSLDRSITSCVDVLKEGRCALASALAVYKFILMYGLITVINQMMTAYFQATFAEWNWVFIDAVWVICLAYTLPLARSATTLAKTRPTASLLCLQTVSSAGVMIVLHLIFTIIALVVLFNEDWFQCRQWVPTDLLNALVLGDNYECQVIWLVTGYQYVSSAIAFNFGYEFRQNWLRNYVFALFVLGFTIMEIYIIFVPGRLSCFFRVNCVNEDVVRGVTGSGEVLPIQNSFNTTMMPVEFQWKLFVIILFNTLAVVGFEYFVVNGVRQRSAAEKAKRIQETEPVQHRGSNFGARRASVAVDDEIILEMGIENATYARNLSRRAFSSKYLMEGMDDSAELHAAVASAADTMRVASSSQLFKPGKRRSVFLTDDRLVEI